MAYQASFSCIRNQVVPCGRHLLIRYIDYINVTQLENHRPNRVDSNPRKVKHTIRRLFDVVTRVIFSRNHSWQTDIRFFFNDKVKRYSEQLKINKCWLSIVCSFPVLMIEIRELKNSKSQQRSKCAENLHKHLHAAILSTNAFKLQSSAQKKAVS